MSLKFTSIFAIGALLSTLLGGCSSEDTDPHQIKVGVIAGLEQQLAEVAKDVAEKRHDLNVKLVVFNDYVLPNEALNNGEIDVNVFQHKPYLDQLIKSRDYKLVAVGHAFIYPLAGYSKKIKSLDELKNGAGIAVPNDPTNLGRSLLLLQKVGLITLQEGVGLLPTLLSITGNPKNLVLFKLDAPLLPRALEDEQITVAVINTTYADQIGLTPKRDGLFVEGQDSPYVNLIMAHENNKDTKNVQKFIQAYQSAEVDEAANTLFKGGAIRGW